MAKKKLTLSIDADLIERAHRYSREHGTSISRLVSGFLRGLGTESGAAGSALVGRLRGILPEDTAVEDHHHYLDGKHS